METPVTTLWSPRCLSDEQFVIVQANQTLATLVSYEAQYKNSTPAEIQKRILALTDFIHEQLTKFQTPEVPNP